MITARGHSGRMTELRGEEKVVAVLIAATLGLKVEQHDDGRQPGMHDLNIMTADGSPAAVEVTAAADPDSIQLWKLVNGVGSERFTSRVERFADGRDRAWVLPGSGHGFGLDLRRLLDGALGVSRTRSASAARPCCVAIG